MSTISSDLIGQRQQRIASAQKLKELGVDPYPSKARKDHANAHVIENYDNFVDKNVILAGRLTSLRDHGKLMFGDILDQSGKIQICIRKDTIEGDLKKGFLGWEELKYVDVGDIVEVEGKINKTQQGAVTLFVYHFKLLTKSIRPLPNQVDDKETIFRKRYLDLILHPENKWRFEKTAQITFAIREFLNSKGFLEIKTPIIQPVYGGTLAQPFRTHVNALNVDYYMAISHELYLKRLITAGFENVFNLVGYFRNEGIDRSHNPEFTMIETMSAYKNYEFNMDLIEEMYKYIATKVFNKTTFKISGQDVDFSKPWTRITMLDAVKKYAGVDFNEIKTLEQAHKVLEDIGAEERPTSIGESMKVVFEEKVEEHLIQPTFLMGHPVEISPLAKSLDSDPRFVERFEIFIGGIEGGDNWTELNDPVELFNRFKGQHERKKHGDEESHPMDIEFVEMMEYGMPPTTGLGPGIERLAMMFTETEYIDDVIFFPMLKPAPITKQQIEIYGKDYLVPQSKLKAPVPTMFQPQDDVDYKGLYPKAVELIDEMIKNEALKRHCYDVEKAMRFYAKQLNANEEKWAITGLLHDIDWETDPDTHPNTAVPLLKKLGVGKDVIDAILGHAYPHRTDVARETELAHYLFACDEITGFINAYSRMKPLSDIDAKAVIKKMKDKAFARNVSREDMQLGAEEIGVSIDQHIENILSTMR